MKQLELDSDFFKNDCAESFLKAIQGNKSVDHGNLSGFSKDYCEFVLDGDLYMGRYTPIYWYDSIIFNLDNSFKVDWACLEFIRGYTFPEDLREKHRLDLDYLSTPEEMKGCPSFVVKNGDLGLILMEFIGVETEGHIVGYENDEYLEWDKVKCDPIDRMNSIAKHLFELMPIKKITKEWNGIVAYDYNFNDIQISINPFLHTNKTEITREELGL